jgi:hypothetical protein
VPEPSGRITKTSRRAANRPAPRCGMRTYRGAIDRLPGALAVIRLDGRQAADVCRPRYDPPGPPDPRLDRYRRGVAVVTEGGTLSGIWRHACSCGGRAGAGGRSIATSTRSNGPNGYSPSRPPSPECPPDLRPGRFNRHPGDGRLLVGPDGRLDRPHQVRGRLQARHVRVVSVSVAVPSATRSRRVQICTPPRRGWGGRRRRTPGRTGPDRPTARRPGGDRAGGRSRGDRRSGAGRRQCCP